MKYNIKVTQGDIDKGKVADCYSCPIAIVFKRLFPGYKIIVSSGLVFFGSFYDYVNRIEYFLPEVAKKFIEDFDNRSFAYIKPFEFEIDLNLP